VAREERRGGTVLVASGDRDTFQLASDRTTILYPVRAGEMARIGPADVRARYGVDPEQVPDFNVQREGDVIDLIVEHLRDLTEDLKRVSVPSYPMV
jgi:DNA polymerase I